MLNAADLDLAQSWNAIAASSGNSFVHETEGALILNGSYDIAFNIDLALKDLGFAIAFGREFGVPLDLASMTNQTYVAAKAAYGGDAQSPMIAKLLEDLLNTDLRAIRWFSFNECIAQLVETLVTPPFWTVF